MFCECVVCCQPGGLDATIEQTKHKEDRALGRHEHTPYTAGYRDLSLEKRAADSHRLYLAVYWLPQDAVQCSFDFIIRLRKISFTSLVVLLFVTIMLAIVLFLQLWVIHASVVKRDDLVAENKTASALNDYPDYDTTSWMSETTPKQFTVESDEENAPPVAVIRQQKREKVISSAAPPMRRYPTLSPQPTERLPARGVSAQHPGYGGYEYQGGYGNPQVGGFDYDGYESAGYNRPYQGIVMGHPRIRNYPAATPRTNYYQYQGGYSSPMGYSYAGYVERQARRFPIMMYTLVKCVPCQRAKHLLAVSYSDIAAHFLELVGDEDWQRQLQVDLQQITRQVTFPYIFICGQHIGGSSDLFALHQSGQLRQMLNNCAPRS